MADINEQIADIEKEIRETPYHKATEHHIGKLRARIARLKDKQTEKLSKKSGGGGGYNVKKQGDATVVLVGPPSVGKSTLLNKLTNARSKIAPYAFTTVTVIPGMMVYNDSRIQILDVPGLIEGAEEGKGRGREVLSVARSADLLIIMTEVGKEHLLVSIFKALERNGIRINKHRPKVLIDKKLSGGVVVHSNINQELDKATIKDTIQEYGIKNTEVYINELLNMDKLIDSLSRNRVYVPAFFVINKVDTSQNFDILSHKNKIFKDPVFEKTQIMQISAEKDNNIDLLKQTIWERLQFVRVYLVRNDEEPHFNNPIIMKQGEDLKDVALSIGSEFAQEKKKAVIWGNGSKFPGQEVSLQTVVQDKMQVRFV